jgi:hypothetical protein
MLGHELPELQHHGRVGRSGRPTTLELRDQGTDALVTEQRQNEQLARFVVGTRESWEQELLLLAEVRDGFRCEEAQELGEHCAAPILIGLRALAQPSRLNERVVMVVRERDE